MVLFLLGNVGSAELGKLVTGHVLSWIRGRVRPTGQSRWTYAAGSTWCFRVKVWVALWFESSGSYWAALGSFSAGRAGNSVSDSFPSECEARVYLDSAGFAEPYEFLD